MCSNTAVRHRIHQGVRHSIYANVPARIAYLLAVLILPAVSMLLAIPLDVVRYWGWNGAVSAVVLIMAIIFAASSFTIFTSVEIGPDMVILRAPVWRRRIRAGDVDRVELNPPVNVLSLNWAWWERDSQCVIHRKTKFAINASFMPDGLKRRIAQTLDPANWPPLLKEE